MRPITVACVVTFLCAPALAASGTPIDFASKGADRQAIEALLGDHTCAVSTKNEALFTSLLLNKDTHFSEVETATRALGAPRGTQDFDDFRRGFFGGAANR